MSNTFTPKNLRMPKVDLKKKPSFELMRHIGKHADQDITPHPFTKLKPPKKEKIEDIFIKSRRDGTQIVKKSKKPTKKEKKNKKKI